MKAILLTVAIALAMPAVPAEDEARFVLGVLRRDGVVLPFASFDGKDWESRWPEGLRWMEIPLLVSDVSGSWWGKAGQPDKMTLWRDGKSEGPIELKRPVMVMPACERRLGLTTDYKPHELPPPPVVRPYPKDGLVTSGPQPIEAIAAVPAGSPEYTAAAMMLIDPSDKAEQLAVDAFSDWDHPVKRKERRKVPVEIEALYRAPMDSEGWTAYHVEAVKRYAPGKNDDGCGLVTSLSGWIGVGPDGKKWTQIGARVTYCDRRGVAYFLPLGLMRLGGRTYWIFQASGYEVERYLIARPTSKSVSYEVGYTAGSCGGF